MTTETLLLVVLIVLVAGAWPAWPYSRSWGYAPTGALTLILIVLVIWAIFGGRIPGRSAGELIGSDMQEAGENLKAAGRNVADSIRNAVE